MSAPTAPTVRVSIGRVQARANGGSRLEWTLTEPDGTKHKKTATHPVEEVMDRFRVQLLDAREENRSFDLTSGLPSGVSRPLSRATAAPTASRPLLYDVRERMHERWFAKGRSGEHKGHTVRSWLNEAIAVCVALLRADAPTLTPELITGARDWLRELFTPPAVLEREHAADEAKRAARRAGGPKDARQRWKWERADRKRKLREDERAAAHAAWEKFFDRYGLRWFEVDEGAVKRALAGLALRTDGVAADETTERKHVVALNELLGWGVRKHKLARNPFAALERNERPSTTTKVTPVDLRRRISMDRLLEVIAACYQLGTSTPTALLVLIQVAIVGLAGLRPSEARGLRVRDLQLPETGWGTATFAKRTTRPGQRYTTDGRADEDGGLKGRRRKVTRTVPLPPMLVAILRWHIARLGLTAGDPVVCDERRKKLEPKEVTEVWGMVRPSVSTADDGTRARGLELRELRHTRAALQLAAGLSDNLVARWFGHSTAVLSTMYDGIVETAGSDLAAEVARFYGELVPPQYDVRSNLLASLMASILQQGGAPSAGMSGVPFAAPPAQISNVALAAQQPVGAAGTGMPFGLLAAGATPTLGAITTAAGPRPPWELSGSGARVGVLG